MPRSPLWPNGAKAAISFTMDNLGEAQDVNKGLWPADQPIGNHFSVKQNLPRMLALLDKHNVKATYFAESWSLGVYPDAVKRLRESGHEVAWHGFQHETWNGQSEEDEKLNFERSWGRVDEFNQLGDGGTMSTVRYEGFRPPGGEINGDRTLDLFAEYGVKYVSPLGKFGIEKNGIVVLPFEWETVDAFWYMEKFVGIRKAHGAQEEPLEPGDFRDYLLKKITSVVESSGYISILFHPFLTTSEERFGVMEEILQRIGKDPDIWCAPCKEVALWVTEHSSQFPRLTS